MPKLQIRIKVVIFRAKYMVDGMYEAVVVAEREGRPRLAGRGGFKVLKAPGAAAGGSDRGFRSFSAGWD